MDRRAWLSLVGVAALPACDAPPSQPPAPSANGLASTQPELEPFRFGTDLDAGIALATREHRRLIVLFTARWSVPCKIQEKLFETPEVVRAASGYVGVLVDVSNQNEQDLAKMDAYHVQSVPAVIVRDSSGKEVYRDYSLEPAEAWVARLSQVG